MADTNAQRQRRHRAHNRGDHSMCRPDSCRRAPGALDPDRPVGDEHRAGAALLAELDASQLDPLSRTLAREVSRSVDRLDRLHAQLTGEDREWLRVEDRDRGDGDLVLVVDGALSEVRQQQNTLRGLINELKGSLAARKLSGSGAEGRGALDSIADELARRRSQARGAGAAGP